MFSHISPVFPSGSLLPRLTQARAPLTSSTQATNEYGQTVQISIPAERALTIYVDKRELVTLMTLGAEPELLVLGYLKNQRLIANAPEIESITVDWDVGAAAVKTRHGIVDIEAKTAKKVVTTGCGQGSVFGALMDEVDALRLPATRILQSQLYGIVNTIRLKESTYKSAGSVHACALFQYEEMLHFVEDVGRHNALDTIAGWMQMNSAPTLATACAALPPEGANSPWGGPAASLAPTPATACSASRPEGALSTGGDPTDGLVFYTTGRLTSEMVIKAAQMGVAVVISRSGITQMGLQVASQLGLCAIGRATNKHFLCYSGAPRLQLQPILAGPARTVSDGR